MKWGEWNKGKVEIKPVKKSKGRLGKGRSSRTNQNKLRDLKSFYEGTFKRSQEVKQSKKYPKRTKYFCDKYSTLKDYLKVYPIKKVLNKR